MTRRNAVYYRAADGSEPVRAVIENLQPRERVPIANRIMWLNQVEGEAPTLPFPQVSHVRGSIRELRVEGPSRNLFRILFAQSGTLFILLHIFRKTSSRTPEVAIRVAEARLLDFHARMDARPRTPPRAVGSDAP